jgi:cystathionine gamma-synthase
MTDDPVAFLRRQPRPDSASAPLVPPIEPSVVYRVAGTDAMDALYEGGASGYTYAREGHPNWTRLAAALDAMEGAESGVVTGSGMAAVGAVFLATLARGDHVLASTQLYGRSLRLLQRELPRMGVEVEFRDPTDAPAWAAALRAETRLMLVEVVANPTIRVADMAGIAALAQERGVPLAVDNTFTTPALYRPLAEGADIVIESVTKMLAGHSDVTLGYAAARDPVLAERLGDIVVSWGLTPSPFDCWLAERGLLTFGLRLERAEANARALADAIAAAPGVPAVFYPTRPDHPDHNRAAALLGGRGGTMVSFRLAGGRAAVDRFLAAAPEIPFAPTLGDVATSVSHPATSSHRGMSEEERQALGIDQGFLRLSVGIEETEGLVATVRRGLAAAAEAR